MPARRRVPSPTGRYTAFGHNQAELSVAEIGTDVVRAGFRTVGRVVNGDRGRTRCEVHEENALRRLRRLPEASCLRANAMPCGLWYCPSSMRRASAFFVRSMTAASFQPLPRSVDGDDGPLGVVRDCDLMRPLAGWQRRNRAPRRHRPATPTLTSYRRDGSSRDGEPTKREACNPRHHWIEHSHMRNR
jgi:hypothetical protein